jgi:oligoribonuclease
MKNKKDISDIYLWFDTEFSSLELDDARLLQVALLPTDAALRRVAPPEHDLNIFIRLAPDEPVSPWVAENLSELVSRCRSADALPVEELDGVVAGWLADNFGDIRDGILERPALAGNSHACDWFLARKFIPSLVDFTSYRMLDVSSWKLHWKNSGRRKEFSKDDRESIQRHLPFPLSGGGLKHDAYFDVQASIAELNYYLQQIEAPEAGR